MKKDIENAKVDVPQGPIELNHHGSLAQEYKKFLYEHDPIDRWQDVVPLADPIEVTGLVEPNYEDLRTLGAGCPELSSLLGTRQDYDQAALISGLRYAWSRLDAHTHLLDVLESHFNDEQFPSAVIEPGCFTGGLIHFLATKLTEVPHIAFDMSPGALKVASKFSKNIDHPNSPYWLEGNFLQLTPELMPLELGQHCGRGLVILSNIVDTIRQQFEIYPCLNSGKCVAGLISYWVNQGCVVLVAERQDEPQEFIQFIAETGEWNEGVQAVMLREFDAWSTRNMSAENPIGDWYNTLHCICGFYPEDAFTKTPFE